MNFTVILICISVFMSGAEWLFMCLRVIFLFGFFFPAHCPHPALTFYRVRGLLKLACRFLCRAWKLALCLKHDLQFLTVHRLQQLGHDDPCSPAHSWSLLPMWPSFLPQPGFMPQGLFFSQGHLRSPDPAIISPGFPEKVRREVRTGTYFQYHTPTQDLYTVHFFSSFKHSKYCVEWLDNNNHYHTLNTYYMPSTSQSDLHY